MQVDLPLTPSNLDPYAASLYNSNPLRAPVLQAAVQSLHLPPASLGLDAGCGIGLQAIQLAEAVGPGGHVTGLDQSAAFLQHARGFAGQAGLGQRISFEVGDLNHLPFANGAFDWLWSADCAGYAPLNPPPLLAELRRVVKPGGTLALLFWSSQVLLPGYPALEARLNATQAGIAPFSDATPPEQHPLRLLGWLKDAGLEQVSAKTFAHSVHTPVPPGIRQALLDLFAMRWQGAEAQVSAADWAEFQRLSAPDSPDLILDRPDYYTFFTYSLFRGTRV